MQNGFFGQRRLRSDCAYAQDDLSLRWAHMSESTFPYVSELLFQPVQNFKPMTGNMFLYGRNLIIIIIIIIIIIMRQ